MAGIIHVIALAILGLSLLLIFPILVAIGAQEGQIATSMLLFGTLGVFLSVVILAAISNLQYNLSRSFSFASLVILWLVTPLYAAVSMIVFTDLSFAAAWFEVVSGLTTSGGSILPKQAVATPIIVWRASLEWFGGFLTLVSILHILAPGEFGGLLTTERQLRPRSGQSTWFPNAQGYQRLITEYAVITLIIASCLMVTGVSSLNSIMLSMVAIATGGFIPFEGALDEQVGRGGQVVIILGLLIGTVNVFWRRSIIRSPKAIFQRNAELKYILVGLGVLSFAYASQLATLAGAKSSVQNAFDYLLEGLFSATSLFATSGMETRPGVLAVVPDILIWSVVLVGASIYSTTGGIKIYRIAMMARHATRELRKLIYPSSVKKLRFGDVAIDETKMAAIWSHFILSLITVGVGGFLISTFGFGFDAALTLSISLFSNAVPVYNAITPPLAGLDPEQFGWPALAESNALAYLLFSCVMLIGRLEVILIFAVFNIRYWLSR